MLDSGHFQLINYTIPITALKLKFTKQIEKNNEHILGGRLENRKTTFRCKQ